FADTAPLAGPMLVACLGGVYLPHVRHRELSKVVTNASAMSVAALGAAVASRLGSSTGSLDVARDAASIMIACLSYWAINNAVVSGYVWCRQGIAVRRVFAELITSDTVVLIWCGLAGAFVVASDGRSVIGVAGVAACVATHALAPNSARRRAADYWERHTYQCQLACWCGAAATLASIGCPLAQRRVLVGAGVAFAFWARTPASATCTVGTAAISLVGVARADPASALFTGAVGLFLLCLVPFSPGVLRSACVITSTLVLSGLVARNSFAD